MDQQIVSHLYREFWEEKQTRGRWWFWNGGRLLYNCVTMENPWMDNVRNISCIPVGSYNVVRRWSEKYKDHWHVQDVQGRTLILIHPGNYHMDTKGCILPGITFADINQDGYQDVTSSRKAFDEINDALRDVDSFILHIT